MWHNKGFVEQLKLFQELEHKVDVNHEKYIKFLEEKKKQQESMSTLYLFHFLPFS